MLKDKDYISVFHAANSGDCVAALAGLRNLGQPVRFCQQLNAIAYYYEGATHGTKDTLGNMVTMNEDTWGMLVPLLEAQPYIESAVVYDGGRVDYDLNRIRGEVYTGIPYMPLQKWISYCYPEMQSDIGDPWLTVPDRPDLGVLKDTVIVNWTARYQNDRISYFFLKRYEGRLQFVGTDEEHRTFMQQWGVQLPRLIVTDFLELAQVLRACKFFIGNQSMCWNIAQGLGSRRVLELSPMAPNCTNFGKNGYEFYHQRCLEYYVDKMDNATSL